MPITGIILSMVIDDKMKLTFSGMSRTIVNRLYCGRFAFTAFKHLDLRDLRQQITRLDLQIGLNKIRRIILNKLNLGRTVFTALNTQIIEEISIHTL